MDTNALYYGDNLEILRKHIPDGSVDLVYLDPPFNSNATYNVLFREPSGKSSQAQMAAFQDTWHWGMDSEKALQEIAASAIAPAATKDFMSVLPKLVGKRTDMSAYLTMMCVRLLELHRVLKDTGSLYLHCDPTASHYLKLLLDTIFGPTNFVNEIIWKRADAKGDTGQGAKHFGRVNDTILFYANSDNCTFNAQYGPLDPQYVEDFYRHRDPDGRRYKLDNMLGPGGAAKGNPLYSVKGVSRYWRFSKQRMQELIEAGRVVQTRPGAVPMYKRYLDESRGTPLTSNWSDISHLRGWAGEKLGYQTQKPLALLERIIQASSNEGDIVLDPFCGCGTAVVAAQRLNRKWIGIDVTHLAIGIMKWRLKNLKPPAVFTVHGEPTDVAGAEQLASENKYEFQWWAATEIGGQPYGDKKKGADTGIDGYLYYMDQKDVIKKAIISVKGGHNVSVAMIRDLGHVIDREKADIGIFITLEKPTQPMVTEAAQKGLYHSPLGRDYPRLQILTIAEIMGGKGPQVPAWIAPVPAQPRPAARKGNQSKML